MHTHKHTLMLVPALMLALTLALKLALVLMLTPALVDNHTALCVAASYHE